MTGRIDPAESQLWYAPNESPATYAGVGFTPLFEPQFPDSATKLRAEKACTVGGVLNRECLYDYSSTGNEKLATNTMNTQTKNAETASELGMLM